MSGWALGGLRGREPGRREEQRLQRVAQECPLYVKETDEEIEL